MQQRPFSRVLSKYSPRLDLPIVYNQSFKPYTTTPKLIHIPPNLKQIQNFSIFHNQTQRFHSTPRHFSKQSFQNKQKQFQKDATNNTPRVSTTDGQTASRSGVKYADQSVTPHNAQKGTKTTKSGIKYADPVIEKPKKVIYNSPSEARESGNAMKQDLDPNPKRRSQKVQGESLLALFNKIRDSKIYQLTRLFIFGSAMILFVRRVQEAVSLEGEMILEGDNTIEILEKVMNKVFRVVSQTLSRVWTPFTKDEDVDDVGDVVIEDDPRVGVHDGTSKG